MENDGGNGKGQPSNRSLKRTIRPRPLRIEHQLPIDSKSRSESSSSSIGFREGTALDNYPNSLTPGSFFADDFFDNHLTLDPAVLEESQTPSCDIPGIPTDQAGVLDQSAIYSNEDFIDPDFIDLSLGFDVDIPLNVFPRDNDTTGANYPPITTNVGGGGKSPENNRRRPRIRISDSQKHILVQWISSHDNPYPTKQDKVQLSQQTGLDLGQISSWFTRTRQRKLPRIDTKIDPDITSPQQINSVETASLLPANDVISQEYWLRSTSVPIEPRSVPKGYSSNGRSQSLPLYYTLRNIYQHRRHEADVFDQDKLSLDVIPSAGKDDIDPVINLEGTGSTRKQLHPIFRSVYGKETPKAASITEWLEGISDGEEPSSSRPLLCPRETDKPSRLSLVTPHDKGIGGHVGLEKLETLIPGSTKQEDIMPLDLASNFGSRVGNATTPDSASIAGSNSRSVSSAGSYMSFGSRRGRRRAFHPTHSQQSRRGSSFSNMYTPNTESEVHCGLGWYSSKRQPSEPVDTRPSKRRRVASPSFSPARRSQHSMDTESEKKYHCTFCQSSFGTAYTWKRHEESVHVPQKAWICAPHHFNMNIASNKCPIRDIVPDMIGCSGTECSHLFEVCWKKAKKDRMFFRKDALKQHIGLVHCKGMSSTCQCQLLKTIRFDDWIENISANDCDLTCYFCGFVNSSWDERAKHTIAHFERGLTIDRWLRPGMPYDPWVDYNVGLVDLKLIQQRNAPKNLSIPENFSFSADDLWDLPPMAECVQHLLETPPVGDMKHSNPNSTPHEQPLTHELDFSTPKWVRGVETTQEGWCGICRPGRWVPSSSGKFLTHMIFTHGMSHRDELSRRPVETRRIEVNPVAWEGLCDLCAKWVPLISNVFWGKFWFRHINSVSIQADF